MRVEPSGYHPDRVYLTATSAALTVDEAEQVIAALQDEVERVRALPKGEEVRNVLLTDVGGHVYLCEVGRVVEDTLYFHEGVHVRDNLGCPIDRRIHPNVRPDGTSSRSLDLREWTTTPQI